MQYNRHTSFSINDIEYRIATAHYTQVTKTQLNMIRKYDALQQANGNTTRGRQNRVMFLLYFARSVKKPFNQLTDDDGASESISKDVIVSEEPNQQQIKFRSQFACYANRWGGQSFKPTVSSLTHVEVYMRKWRTPPSDVVLSIRSSLYSADLTNVSKSASEIATSYSLVGFNFSDITVTPGKAYYLVLRTTGGTIMNTFYWGYGLRTPYTNGEYWHSTKGGSPGSRTKWTSYDFCFKTYGT